MDAKTTAKLRANQKRIDRVNDDANDGVLTETEREVKLAALYAARVVIGSTGTQGKRD